MKHKLLSLEKINNRLFAFLFLAIFAILLLKAVVSMPMSESNPEISYSVKSIEYLEDASGSLNLEGILSGQYDGGFSQKKGSTLSIGQSRSVWWIRINLNGLPTDSSAKYLSIINPTIERAVLYIPKYAGEEIRYDTLYSGWGFSGKNQDEGYLYPVFKLDDTMDLNHEIYLQLSSPFTQNYNIGILHAGEFEGIKRENLLILGIFYGLLLAMGIGNFFSFLSFKDHVQLFYVIYILSMLFYHGALLGLFRIFMGPTAEILIGNVVTWGLFMVAAVVMFFRSFLVTEEYYPRQDKILITILFLCLAGILLMGFGLKYEASVISILPATGAILITVFTSFMAVRNGIRSAKFFLAGWCAMLFSFIVFTARVWGILPNNDLTLFIVLLSAAIEAILLSLALADRIRILRNEKEQALLLFRSAEETSLYNESAFLQAQIKPHFLYNALNIIATLCRIDAEKARMLILDLSGYLRHSFDFRNLKKYISFDEELDFIQAYVRIEQARFRDKLEVEYEIDHAEELQIPPLILQPLVENAIRHGLRKSDEAGRIVLRVKNIESNYIIEVEDDGAGMTSEQIDEILSGTAKEGGGVGLANIRRRLKVLYGTQLMIDSNVGKGTKITLILPKRKDEL